MMPVRRGFGKPMSISSETKSNIAVTVLVAGAILLSFTSINISCNKMKENERKPAVKKANGVMVSAPSDKKQQHFSIRSQLQAEDKMS